MEFKQTSLFVQAYAIRTHQGDTQTLTLLSHLGTASTQYNHQRPDIPTRGVIVRYADGMVLALDHGTRTFQLASLDEVIAGRLAERERVAQSIVPHLGSSLGLPPPPRLVHVSDVTRIKDIPARSYLLQDPLEDRLYRLTYANQLPRPPGPIRHKLAALQPVNVPTDHTPCNDDTGDDRPDEAVTFRLAGRMLLRMEIQEGHRWISVLDTDSIEHVQVPCSIFSEPSGWQMAEAASSPAARAAAIESHLTSLTATAVGETCPPDLRPTTTANVIGGPGPYMYHPEVHVFFWGRTFADPAHSHAVNELSRAFTSNGGFFLPQYTGFLSTSYGIQPGQFESRHIIDEDPPGFAGGGGAGAIVGPRVVTWGLEGKGPLFWWQLGNFTDPLYVIFLPESVVDPGSWEGFHFLAFNLVITVIPWPFNMVVHEGMPYAVIKVPDRALQLPQNGLLFRGDCTLIPGLCDILPSFDMATIRASHEYVEAVTDPFPFWGFSDIGKVPVWTKGEIADICKDASPWSDSTGVGNYVVSTFWSTVAQACVPESRPTIAILAPDDGENIPWSIGGSVVLLRGQATDPLLGDISAQIRWSVDAVPASTGREVPSLPLSLGSHTIQAWVQGASAASVCASVQVKAQPPTVAIFSPANGASIPADAIIAFRGEGSDPQDGLLPDLSLVWRMGGTVIGTGRSLADRISTQGPIPVTLTGTNSAGLTATASYTLNIIAPTGNPSVAITSPVDGEQFSHPTGLILFSAVARDASGNPLPDSGIRWESSVDGPLKKGNTIQTQLSSGFCAPIEHRIMVRATDPSGRIATDAITITAGTIC
jgi:hypothetical protein